jgi:phosphate transport system substrate-binding protein
MLRMVRGVSLKKQGDDMRRSLAVAVSIATVATSLLGSAVSASTPKPAFPAIVGNGSSFQGNWEAACIAKFNAKAPTGYSTNGNVSYTVSSSGTGMGAFNSGTADFAGTDAPDFTKTPKDGGNPIAVPITAAAVGFIYNVQDANGALIKGLKFTPALLDAIYKGTVTYWDADAIQLANGAKWVAATRTKAGYWKGGMAAKLQHTPISVNVRADGSGTTKNLNLYMAANVPGANWNTSGSKNWGSGSGLTVTSGSVADFTKRSNSDAMVQAVKATNGAFGYADAPDAVTAVSANDVAFGKLLNVHGEFELPSAGTGTRLIDNAKALAGITTNGFLSSSESVSLFSVDAPGAYQLTVISYVMGSTANTTANTAVKAYLTYALKSCQGAGGFVGLTKDLVAIANAQVAKLG